MSDKPVVAPFRGVRYNLKNVDLSKVVAPPYDVISADLQKELYERDPHNVVRLILGFQNASDSDQENRYTRAAADLQKWTKEGVLERDSEPCLYLYEQFFEWNGTKGKESFTRRGFLALRRLEEFGKGKIRPHEKTLSGPKADRLLLIKACKANLSPIFSLYSDPKKEMANLLRPAFHTEPLADFTDKEGVRHRFWKVSDKDIFAKTDKMMGDKTLFIADGHHRYETSIAYRNWLKEQGTLSENSSANYVMMFFSEMSDPGLLILPTHRILKNWSGFAAATFRKELEKYFVLKSVASQAELSGSLKAYEGKGHAFGLLLDGKLHLAVAENLPSELEKPIIDTAILHRLILGNILGFKEEDEKNPKYLKFVKGENEVFEAVATPGFNAGFLLNSSPMEVLQQVVEAGRILPPKTTFFYPKLLSGLVLNQVEAKGEVTI
jgi:uncharacterized protein (DUF1015 family)